MMILPMFTVYLYTTPALLTSEKGFLYVHDTVQQMDFPFPKYRRTRR